MNNYNFALLKSNYEKIIHMLKIEVPNIQIYIQALYPITKSLEENPSFLINKKDVDKMNAFLSALSEENDIFFINMNFLADENGYLPEQNSCDTIHLMGNKYIEISNVLYSEIFNRN